MSKNEKPEKVTIITTSDHLTRKKSAFRKGIITTADVNLPVQKDDKKPGIITTSDDKKESKDEK